MGEITKKPLNSSREWQEEELEKLEELFEQYKEAENPGSRIHEQWKAANMPVRSKKKLCDKIVELNWVTDRSKLGKTKTRNRKPKEGEAGYLNTKSDSDSALNSSSSEDEAASSEEELNANMVEDTSSKGLDLGDALRQLDGGETATLTWLADTLNEEGEDRRMEFDGEDVPLVAVAEEHQLALVKDVMVQVLSSLGLCAPSQGEQFWRIPGDMSVDQLKARATVLAAVGRGDGVANAMLGVESNLLIVVRGLGAVVENRKVEKKKKKKRGPNKWMPFRRAEADMPPPPAVKEKTPGKEQKKSTKAKNASFLDSSDEEKEENVDDVEDVVDDMEVNDENADPENKENVPQKKTPTPKKIVSKKSTIDKARLLKLLNDDSDLGSTDSDDAQESKSQAQSDTSDEGVVDPLPGAEKPVKAKKPRAPRKKAEKTAKAEPKKKQQAKKATKKAGKKVADDESDNDADSEEGESKKKQPKKKVSKAKKAAMAADSSDNDVNDSNEASESDDDVPLSTRSSKKSTKKALAADSSDEEIEKPTKKQNSKKKSAVDSSSDEGVTDPTQPTDEPIAAASSDDEFGKAASKKKSMLDSDSDEEPVAKSTKKKMSLDSDSDDATKPNSKSDYTKKETPIKAADVSRRSRSRSSSIDSRRSISPLEDSRIARRSISPLEDSRIGRRSLSPLDDSRLSRRSSFDDSRLRSPISSPLSRARSSSRSLSPLSPTPHTPYTLAETPAAKKGKSGKTPASKKVNKDTPVIKTPVSRKSRAKETPVTQTQASKKSRAKETPVTQTQ